MFIAETDINTDRIRNIEKCFGSDNKVSMFNHQMIHFFFFFFLFVSLIINII